MNGGGIVMDNIFASFENEALSLKTSSLHVLHREEVMVRRASVDDADEIYHIACSVGNAVKDPYQGFLVDDYTSDPFYYKSIFRRSIMELDHFYVAQKNNRLLGFLMVYTKEQWLRSNGNWLDEIVWHPEFDRSRTGEFVMVSKTATRANLTSRGIGSRLYNRMVEDIKASGIHDIFAETVVHPVPNFASLAFRKKQDYSLAGIRYENYRGEILTDHIYHKSV
jgi:predicted GNAT superfamily acetyltransferase